MFASLLVYVEFQVILLEVIQRLSILQQVTRRKVIPRKVTLLNTVMLSPRRLNNSKLVAWKDGTPSSLFISLFLCVCT